MDTNGVDVFRILVFLFVVSFVYFLPFRAILEARGCEGSTCFVHTVQYYYTGPCIDYRRIL